MGQVIGRQSQNQMQRLILDAAIVKQMGVVIGRQRKQLELQLLIIHAAIVEQPASHSLTGT